MIGALARNMVLFLDGCDKAFFDEVSSVKNREQIIHSIVAELVGGAVFEKLSKLL